jgi:hypothetical protein
MTLTQLFLSELDREAPRTRRALEQVPLDRDDWTPHPKSMPLGRLAGLVASMPSWINLIIEQDELNLTPPHVVLRDTLNHLAHHRGQLTVYLRLNGRAVPAIYGPSADDQSFA